MYQQTQGESICFGPFIFVEAEPITSRYHYTRFVTHRSLARLLLRCAITLIRPHCQLNEEIFIDTDDLLYPLSPPYTVLSPR